MDKQIAMSRCKKIYCNDSKITEFEIIDAKILITPMALAHPLYPNRNKSGKSRNLWTERCVFSWWSWFWSVDSSHYFIHVMYHRYILSNWKKLSLRDYRYQELVWLWRCGGSCDIAIISCLVSIVCFNCIVQEPHYHDMDIGTMRHCALVSCIQLQSIGLVFRGVLLFSASLFVPFTNLLVECYFSMMVATTTGPRLNIKTVLSTYGNFHVKDKTAVRTSYL